MIRRTQSLVTDDSKKMLLENRSTFLRPTSDPGPSLGSSAFERSMTGTFSVSNEANRPRSPKHSTGDNSRGFAKDGPRAFTDFLKDKSTHLKIMDVSKATCELWFGLGVWS